MSMFDLVYSQLVRQVINEGVAQDSSTVRAHYADGKPAPTISVEGVSFAITPEMGVPILQSKFVGHKWAFTEIEWIWQEMSNDVEWLNDRGVTIWDSWRLEDSTIGKAYGWQLANKKRWLPKFSIGGYSLILNQVDYVINQLKFNPSSRRIMTTLWDVEDLDEMSLEPCVWATHWTVQSGKLNLHVKQRSADICLGLPYNVLQYHALHALMADEVGLELGTMYWNIDNAHIYDRHIGTIKEQTESSYDVGVLMSTPKLVLPEGRDFYDRRLSGAKIVDYKHNGTYTYEVAI